MYEGLPLGEADCTVGKFAHHERRADAARTTSSDEQQDESDSQAHTAALVVIVARIHARTCNALHADMFLTTRWAGAQMSLRSPARSSLTCAYVVAGWTCVFAGVAG